MTAPTPTLRSVAEAVSDAQDIMIGVQSVLQTSLEDLSARDRGALSTLVRFGIDRLTEAQGQVDAIRDART